MCDVFIYHFLNIEVDLNIQYIIALAFNKIFNLKGTEDGLHGCDPKSAFGLELWLNGLIGQCLSTMCKPWVQFPVPERLAKR